MSKIARPYDTDPLLLRPDGEVFEVAVAAGCSGVLGVDVEVGEEAHERILARGWSRVNVRGPLRRSCW